jgi:hypothetical protein
MDGWMDGSTLFKDTLIFSTILMLVSKRGVYYYDRINPPPPPTPLITYDV